MPEDRAAGAKATSQGILTLPAGTGRTIVRAGALIVCPMLGTDNFVRFCKDRGLSINRERLLRLERLGLFAPVYRVRTPRRALTRFIIPPAADNDWFRRGWAWDTTSVRKRHAIPDPKDRSQEGYYSVFQLDHLALILTSMSLQVELDSFLESSGTRKVDWGKNGTRWLQYSQNRAQALREHEFRRSLALLCQFISNRYYPHTHVNRR